MKKVLYFAAAALALAACSKNEVLDVNKGEAIGFRTIVNGSTKAADLTTSNIAEFTVEAINNGGDNDTKAYFSDVQFAKDGSTFVSTKKYYWPANNLDFYAYSPSSNAQVAKTNYKTFVVTPSATVADQVDLVYGSVIGADKTTYGTTGVPINFRHTGSKIVCQVKNTADNLKFEVTGWKVGYLDNAGTFTYDGTTTTSGVGQLPYAYWTDNTSYSADNTYATTFTKKDIAANAGATSLPGEMILVPQKPTKATAYSGAAAGSKVNGSYIGVQIKIMNTDTNSTLVQDTIWAIWPVDLTWEPGKKYTYTVDLVGGGYKEVNDNATEESGHETDLDPVLDNAVIFFDAVNVTVDSWSDATETQVTMPNA